MNAILKDSLSRAVNAFAQSLLAAITVSSVAGVAGISWLPVLSIAGLAALASLLQSVIRNTKSDGT